MQGPITRLRRGLLASFLQEPVSAAPGQAERKGSGRSNRGRKKQLSCQLGLAWHFGVVPVEHRGLPLILNTFNLSIRSSRQNPLGLARVLYLDMSRFVTARKDRPLARHLSKDKLPPLVLCGLFRKTFVTFLTSNLAAGTRTKRGLNPSAKALKPVINTPGHVEWNEGKTAMSEEVTSAVRDEADRRETKQLELTSNSSGPTSCYRTFCGRILNGVANIDRTSFNPGPLLFRILLYSRHAAAINNTIKYGIYSREKYGRRSSLDVSRGGQEPAAESR